MRVPGCDVGASIQSTTDSPKSAATCAGVDWPFSQGRRAARAS